MMLFTATIACLALGATSSPTVQKDYDEGNLLVTVFYESYCPGSIKYMTEQIIPAWKRFKADITLDLVPYGNAVQWYEDGKFKFECQFGEKECVGNKLHACAIQEACGAAGTKQCGEDGVSRALAYIDCMGQSSDQEKANHRCATSAKLNHKLIAKCAHSEEGDRLHSLYGNQTEAFKPPVRDVGVPFIAFDGESYNEKAFEGPTYMIGAICSARPNLCDTSKQE